MLGRTRIARSASNRFNRRKGPHRTRQCSPVPGHPLRDQRAASRRRRECSPLSSGGPVISVRLLVTGTPKLVARFPDLLARLLDDGAELVFTCPPQKLSAELRAHPRSSTVSLPLERTGPDADAIAVFRTAAHVVRFLGPELESARWPRERVSRRLASLLGSPWTRDQVGLSRSLQLPSDVTERLAASFRALEHELPLEDELVRAAAAIGADAVLVLTRCEPGGAETDVIKVARRLELPSIMLLCSWDNLTSKASLIEHPDRLLVWNEDQAREARDLHGVPPERLWVIGASNFDRFFDELAATPVAPQGETRRLLYLGSSTKVVPREAAVVEDWIAALRGSGDQLLVEAEVLVRPHPSAVRRFARWVPPDERVTLSSPTERIEPARLAKLLRATDAVVALNTSAEIEAAIASVPVVTFRAGSRARGQEGSYHFAYLLEANGGFVIDTPSLEAHVTELGRILREGHDQAPARAFVERFVRPGGIAESVVPKVAAAILELSGAGTQSGRG
jgi:hypothetical protein